KCEPFANLHPHFLKRRDIGYAYWCLCQHAMQSPANDPEMWPETALTNAGLPNTAAITKGALSEMKSLLGSVPTGEIGAYLHEVITYGISVFEKHGVSRIRDIY